MQTNHSVVTEGCVWEVKTLSGSVVYKASRRLNGVWDCETFRFLDNAKAWAGI